MQKTIPITENHDFLRLYKKGRSFVDPSLVLYYSRNRLKVNRLGITTSKKIGKACKRNRARRIIREAYRLAESRTLTGYDFVFVARGRTVSLKTGDLSAVISRMFTRAGVLAK